MNCPVCDRPLNGKILVCEACWWKVSPKDRSLFASMWRRSGGSKNPAGWQTKGDQIVRRLSQERSAVIEASGGLGKTGAPGQGA